MKAISSLILILLFTFAVKATAQEVAAKDGFVLKTSTNEINLVQGESKRIEIEVIKAKRYAKKNVEISVQGRTPAGLDIQIEQPNENDLALITIKAENTADLGTKMIIVQGKTARFTKASLIKINVIEETISAR
jgi:uncharacterized membrane protein